MTFPNSQLVAPVDNVCPPIRVALQQRHRACTARQVAVHRNDRGLLGSWLDHRQHQDHVRKIPISPHFTCDKPHSRNKVTRAPSLGLCPRPPARMAAQPHPARLDPPSSTVHTVCSRVGHSCPVLLSPPPGLWQTPPPSEARSGHDATRAPLVTLSCPHSCSDHALLGCETTPCLSPRHHPSACPAPPGWTVSWQLTWLVGWKQRGDCLRGPSDR